MTRSHGAAAGELLAAELRIDLSAEPEIFAAFGGRIVDRADGWARPFLQVGGRSDGGATILVEVRGTPDDARQKLERVAHWVEQRSDLRVAYRDSFRSADKRTSFALVTVRRRDQLLKVAA